MSFKEKFVTLFPSEEDIASCNDEDDKAYLQNLRTEGLALLEGKTAPESLYGSLHRVGDDPIKGAIQRSLKELLDN